MGINPTLPNFKTFTFGGVNSATYGVYITGEGVFNAPERNVEMIDIAGRNGAFALDKGNFNNIEVTYPASIATDNETDFAEAVSDLRNFLCSKVGYVRLEDDYNTGEYRLAIYKSGLEVSHDMLIAGEFDIVFECKPQRFLTSGETKTTLTSGNALTNPTLFDAKPQLQVYGTGNITISGQDITVASEQIGDVRIPYDGTTVDLSALNTGDNFSVDFNHVISYKQIYTAYRPQEATITSHSGCTVTTSLSSNTSRIHITCLTQTFAKGTSKTFSASVVFSQGVLHNGTITSTTVTATLSLSYDGSSTLTHSITVSPSVSNTLKEINGGVLTPLSGYSTKWSTGNPMYIDLDVGECYNLDYGYPVSTNDSVSLPAELPVLKPGSNAITFDNTFTKVDIIPRWWKV